MCVVLGVSHRFRTTLYDNLFAWRSHGAAFSSMRGNRTPRGGEHLIGEFGRRAGPRRTGRAKPARPPDRGAPAGRGHARARQRRNTSVARAAIVPEVKYGGQAGGPPCPRGPRGEEERKSPACDEPVAGAAAVAGCPPRSVRLPGRGSRMWRGRDAALGVTVRKFAKPTRPICPMATWCAFEGPGKNG